ncbi:MAG: 4Fe-4S binding protein [Candidatus Aenigmatarchaeota archaeon]
MSLLREALSNLFKKPFTRRYPREGARPYPRFRGMLVYKSKKCIGCQLCNRNCPSAAITFYKKGRIDFDMSKCMQCGLCVDVCPVDAIEWSTNFEMAAADKKKFIIR